MPAATKRAGVTGELRKLIEKSGQLPAQPSALGYLLRALDDAESDAHELTAAIERFPPIAARLISLANSAWSAPAEPIMDVEHACIHLGSRLVRTASMSMAVMAPFNTARCNGFASESFWCNTFLIAASAERVSASAGIDEELSASTARTAGLLHNLGLLWLADKVPEPTARAIANVHDGDTDLNTSLRSFCGTDACEVGGLLGRSWQLPDELVVAMEYHDNPQYDGIGWQYAAVVGGVAGIVDTVTRGSEEQVTDKNLDRLGVSQSTREDVLADVAAKLDDTLELTRTLRL